MTDDTIQTTALHALHVELGARMVPFAGYDMPVQYPTGILTEHNWTRENAGLFDVSHMGQVTLRGEDPAKALEALVPGDLQALKEGRTRYTMFTNADGGILDDLMVTKIDHNTLFVVVNAACKAQDIALMVAGLKGVVDIEVHETRALMALQGPKAKDVMARLAPGSQDMVFLSGKEISVGGLKAFITRSGYTGEDGWEISVAAEDAIPLARALLADLNVKAIGLGARDSLRLEAGLCLYGHDIDTTTSPIEADLKWTISKRRREEGGFPGAATIQKHLAEGTSRLRVGIKPEGRAPAREHTPVYADEALTQKIGEVTSGGFGPTVGGPVAMGYVGTAHASVGTKIFLEVRGKALPATVAALPFTTHNYQR